METFHDEDGGVCHARSWIMNLSVLSVLLSDWSCVECVWREREMCLSDVLEHWELLHFDRRELITCSNSTNMMKTQHQRCCSLCPGLEGVSLAALTACQQWTQDRVEWEGARTPVNISWVYQHLNSFRWSLHSLQPSSTIGNKIFLISFWCKWVCSTV